MESNSTLAEKWLSLDKDPETRSEIKELVRQEDHAELEKLLRDRITFGTAGLRARMQAGFARMNSLTVIQASQGLAEYLIKTVPGVQTKGVIIGFDSRFNSSKFASLAAAAFMKKQLSVFKFDKPIHTPIIPYSIKKWGLAAGIMITASHNPAEDNGYKVYWKGGCQIIPPHDAGIAASIEQNLEPACWDTQLYDTAPENRLKHPTALHIKLGYHEKVQALATRIGTTTLPKFVYTPLHGVGLVPMEMMMRGLSRLPTSTQKDSNPMHVVEEQAQPDPTFPTVKFPNPEEAGALALAMSTADRHSIRLIVANDPDADRFAAAEKIPDTNEWYQFKGNQIGVLLAALVLSLPEFSSTETRKSMAMLCSTVSTGMLKRMAEVENFNFVETLTGFKWLGNVAQELQKSKGWKVPYAFEEALGYMFTEVAYDKDGISAAAVFLAAAEKWQREENLTPWGKLQQLYEKYGFFADANTYLISPNKATTTRVFQDIRNAAAPARHPASIGAYRVTRFRDLTVGFDTATPDNVPDLPVDGASEMITWELEEVVRMTIRGSGTEPKIKIYLEAVGRTDSEARGIANSTRDWVIQEWFSDPSYGLVRPA